MAGMLPTNSQGPTHAVVCVHCATSIQVPVKAETATCPRCYKRQTVRDVIVDTDKMGARVETTGILFVKRKGRVWAPGVKAGEAVEVLGELRANVETVGHVVIGATARWRGDCTAKILVVEDGARIEGGFFRIDPTGELSKPPATSVVEAKPDVSSVEPAASDPASPITPADATPLANLSRPTDRPGYAWPAA